MQTPAFITAMQPIPRSMSTTDILWSAVWWARTGLAIYGGYVLFHDMKR